MDRIVGSSATKRSGPWVGIARISTACRRHCRSLGISLMTITPHRPISGRLRSCSIGCQPSTTPPMTSVTGESSSTCKSQTGLRRAVGWGAVALLEAEPALNNPGVDDQSASTPVHRRGIPTCLILDLGKRRHSCRSSQSTAIERAINDGEFVLID